MSNTEGSLPQDVAFDILSNARRRFVLRSLQESDGGVDLSDLAAELAAMENEVDRDELTAKQRKRAYVSLYQTHIPKMEESGVITYDRDAGIVSPTPHVGELSAYFRDPTTPPPWHLAYGAVAMLGFLTYIAITMLEGPIINAFHVGIGFVVVVALVSIVHYISMRRRTADVAIPIAGEYR